MVKIGAPIAPYSGPFRENSSIEAVLPMPVSDSSDSLYEIGKRKPKLFYNKIIHQTC